MFNRGGALQNGVNTMSTKKNTTSAATVAAYIPESVATATAEAQRKGAQNHEDAWLVIESEPAKSCASSTESK